MDYLNDSYLNMKGLYDQNPSISIDQAFEPDSEWLAQSCYWLSLMHSNDADQVSVQDVIEFNETGEDWPVKQGYGALIQKQGEFCPVRLNTRLLEIDWSGTTVKLKTNKGDLKADKVIITVSTGILGSGDIKFSPGLPQQKRDAIDALPMGNYNYQIFSVEPGAFDGDSPEYIHYEKSDICMTIRIRPFATPCVWAPTAGRFAWWLEKQGTEASKAYFEEALTDVFGSNIKTKLGEFKVSAWGYDSWTRGAYSSQKPGFRDQRQKLKESIANTVFFAGEATSLDFLNTAHGAYLSGHRAVEAVLQSMK